MNPWHAVVANEAQQYKPVIRDGSRKLVGILAVSKRSGIDSLDDLQGQTLAFPAPNALGASLLMRAELKNIHGIDINPIYVKTHSSVYLNVALGKTAAGGGVWRTLKSQSTALQNRLKVIYETRPISPHPIVVHPRVGDAVQQKIQQAILQMSAAEESAALLQKIPLKQAVASDISDYAPLKELGLRAFYVE